jgi:hypothetical protein
MSRLTRREVDMLVELVGGNLPRPFSLNLYGTCGHHALDLERPGGTVRRLRAGTLREIEIFLRGMQERGSIERYDALDAEPWLEEDEVNAR